MFLFRVPSIPGENSDEKHCDLGGHPDVHFGFLRAEPAILYLVKAPSMDRPWGGVYHFTNFIAGLLAEMKTGWLLIGLISRLYPLHEL